MTDIQRFFHRRHNTSRCLKFQHGNVLFAIQLNHQHLIAAVYYYCLYKTKNYKKGMTPS